MFFPFYGFYYNSYYMIGTIFVILAAILALWAGFLAALAVSSFENESDVYI